MRILRLLSGLLLFAIQANSFALGQSVAPAQPKQSGQADSSRRAEQHFNLVNEGQLPGHRRSPIELNKSNIEQDSKNSKADKSINSSAPQPGTLAATQPAGLTIPSESLATDLPEATNSWMPLLPILVDHGASEAPLRGLLSDPRMPNWNALVFNLKPKESNYLYRKHNTKSTRANALQFYKKFSSKFREAEKKFGVPQEVVLAIIQIESQCGAATGKSRVFPALARLASAALPQNIEANLKSYPPEEASELVDAISKRAQWLTSTFAPHAVAAIKLAKQHNLDPLDLKGSGSGAVGIPQFLPGNFEKYGADGNGDNRIDPFEPRDAIFSVASFLKAHGWKKKNLPAKEKSGVIWHYNRSPAYVATVLKMAENLRRNIGVK